MKKLITILLLMVLTSCGSSLEPPKSNTDYKNIIGNPIKIDTLEVAQNDFPREMNWNEANKACEALGNGWRLPTKDELNILYQNKDKIGGFASASYWSSSEYVIDYEYVAWFQYFSSGVQTSFSKDVTLYVRAIRAF